MQKVKNIISSCWSTFLAMMVVFILWIAKISKVSSDFAPFFFAWSIPIIVISIVVGKWLFWTYFVLWLLFLGTRAVLEAAEDLH